MNSLQSTKRPVEHGPVSSSKRQKNRKSEKLEAEKLAEKITTLIDDVKLPGKLPHEIKAIESDIYSNKLKELGILHGHLKEDSRKLYFQKKKLETKVEELQANLASKQNKAQDKMKLLENELSSVQFDLLMTKEELQETQKKWEKTIAQMKMQHAKELRVKDDALEIAKAVANLPRSSSKSTKAKMAALMQQNSELVAINEELTESVNRSQGELLATKKATQKLLEQKHETEIKYQALLKKFS